MRDMAEVAIIGGGIVGAALACRLAEAGVRVTLLDAGEPGGGTSSASFAWLNSAHKHPRAYHALNVAGMAEHAALGAAAGDAPWLHRVGGLGWATTPEGQERQRRDAARLREWGYRIEALDPERAARELEPGLRLDPARVPEVWHAPDEGWVDVPTLVRYLLDRARERGATIRANTAVAAIAHDGGRVRGLTLADRATLATDAIVNCAGPRADEVAALLDWALPIARVPGLLAVTVVLATPARCVCVAEGITFRADPSGGMVLAHAEDLDRTIDADTPRVPPPPACDEALARAAVPYPALRGVGIAAARIGVRPVPRDGVSIVGRVPGFANAYVAVTHSGVTLGPLLGRLLAGEIAGGDAAAQLAPFRPERFGVV